MAFTLPLCRQNLIRTRRGSPLQFVTWRCTGLRCAFLRNRHARCPVTGNPRSRPTPAAARAPPPAWAAMDHRGNPSRRLHAKEKVGLAYDYEVPPDRPNSVTRARRKAAAHSSRTPPLPRALTETRMVTQLAVADSRRRIIAQHRAHARGHL